MLVGELVAEEAELHDEDERERRHECGRAKRRRVPRQAIPVVVGELVEDPEDHPAEPRRGGAADNRRAVNGETSPDTVAQAQRTSVGAPAAPGAADEEN